jgi:hypothetical protein
MKWRCEQRKGLIPDSESVVAPRHAGARIGTAHLLSAVLCVVAAGMAACSSDSDGGDNPDSVEPQETNTAISGPTGDLVEPQGAIDALSDFTCKPGEGGTWSAEGTLTNSSKSETRFLVTVSVISSKTHQVLGDAEKTYALKAGANEQITLREIYSKHHKGLECVPRVISGG